MKKGILILISIVVLSVLLIFFILLFDKISVSEKGPCPMIQPICDFIIYNVTKCVHNSSSKEIIVTTDLVLVKESDYSISGFKYMVIGSSGSFVNASENIPFGAFYNKTISLGEDPNLVGPFRAYLVPVLEYPEPCNVICNPNLDYFRNCEST